MGSMFSTLFAKISAVVAWFSGLFVAIFVALWDLLKDAFSWVFDQIVTVALSAVNAVDVSALQGLSIAPASFSAQVLEVFRALGLGECLGFVAAAIAVRFALQLIPFTRLGS